MLPGSDATPANSVLRVLSDVMGALCHLVLQYIDWLSKQLLPDTAETEWLDRHGQIWLVNSDGTTGRKQATLATGTVMATGLSTNMIPKGSLLYCKNNLVEYQTTQLVFLSEGPTPVPIMALTPGTVGNLEPQSVMSFLNPPSYLNSIAVVVSMMGGADPETDEELRVRILKRIQQPPMGGDATDYEQWALAVPGVTRAWASPQEMGIGTMTVRFMMDDLRAAGGGFPLPDDVLAVSNYINKVRPVTVKDCFVEAPIPVSIPVRITYLDSDTRATHGAILESLKNEFYVRQKPGQTWYRAWSDEGVMQAAGVNAYDMVGNDVPMPGNGYMPVLGDVTYG
jgi:uncharacterized phage protein gp47/JayE